MKKSLAVVALAGSALVAAGWGYVGIGSEAAVNGGAVETLGAERAAAYSLDAVHSSVVFRVRHVGAANFYGRFNEFEGSFEIDEASNQPVSVTFEIPMESVDTNNSRRDGHLRSGDFFNVGQYPTASFTSTGYESTGDTTGTLTGELTFMGQTREITAEVVDIGTGAQGDAKKFGFEARFSFDRSDFGVTSYLADDGGNDGPIGNTVDMMVAIEAVKD
ncbi:MAG: YceI family protein [Phycisphaerales bacterium JB040]